MITAHLNERSLPLRRSLRTAHGPVTVRRVLVLVLQDDDGNIGLGEAAPLPAFGGEDPISCREVLDGLLPDLPELTEDWLDNDRPGAGLGAAMELRLAHTPCARYCVEGALLDLYATREGKPLADVLKATIDEAPCLRSLPVNALMAGSRGEAMAEAASGLVADGWRTVKIKVSGDPATAIERVATLRDHVGRMVNIRVDANAGWNFEDAKTFLTGTAELNLEYLEQPVAADDLDAMARLAQVSRTPIAADESIRAAGDIGRLAAVKAANIAILKPMLLGGWRATHQATELAQRLGLGVVITSFLDGAVGRALATHMAAALDLCDRAQGLASGGLMTEDLTDEPLRARQGTIQIGEEAGLGIGYLIPELG